MTNTFPPPIISTQPGSWANTTVKDRLPEIARRVIEENQFSSDINDQLTQLQEGIPDQPIRELLDRDAPDYKIWQGYIQPYLGKKWLTVPWFFVETYFYRRIMEAVDYFQLGLDPFVYQKIQGLENTREDTAALARFLAEGLEKPQKKDDILRDGLYFSLWGNQADLSLWPAGSKTDPRHDSRKTLREHLLADDIKQVLKIFTGKVNTVRRVDIMLDNAGFELVSDLALADILLSHWQIDEVILHIKAHPTFVSDVIEKDLDHTIPFLVDSKDQATARLGKRLDSYFQEGRIQARAHFFWNSPLPLWKLPANLEQDIKGSSLLVSKGDANYRRILGDREWDLTIPFHQAVDYLHVPLVALRTSKAEIAVGLDLDQIQFVFNQDPNWLVDGKWAVIHFAPGKSE